MKVISLIIQIIVLYGFYTLGSWMQEFFNLFVPGSIIGMLILFILLYTGVWKNHWIEQGAGLLIRYFPLLFLPVTVGVIQYSDLFVGKGIVLAGIIIVSTVLVMLSSGFFTHFLWKRMEGHNE